MSQIKKQEIFEEWLFETSKEKKNSRVLYYVKEKFQIDEMNDDLEKLLREKTHRLCRTIEKKWMESNRTKVRFLNTNATWLQEYFVIEEIYVSKSTGSSGSLSADVGRPRLPFMDQSHRSQRRTASRVSNDNSDDWALLLKAAESAARKYGNTVLAQVLKKVSDNPDDIKQLLDKPKQDQQETKSYSVEEALELVLDLNLSKRQYLDLRKGALSKNIDLYPDYKKLWQLKPTLRPSGIYVCDVRAEVPLSNLLEHTAKRLVLLQKDVLLQHMDSLAINRLSSELICSYGFDGSSGYSLYKQKFDQNRDVQSSDASLFATTLIPIRLLTSEKTILWNNRTPQSTRFCRPLKLEYVKETKEHILKEKANIDMQIKQLNDLEIVIENKVLVIKFVLFMTLIDGKVLSIITGSKSSQACPICGATPKHFLQIQVKDFQTSPAFQPKPNTLNYGISPLHAWIRFFECILHIGYRLELKEWQMRGDAKKTLYNARKKLIQKSFLETLSLHVDKPKSNGFGSTNDGNTSRKAFTNASLFSKITGVDESLIKKLRVILICLSCQYEIDTREFQKYCNETAELYLKLYSWYPMPSTLHKVLVHGKDIIENCLLPVGCLGEEASEARNKLYKQDRLFHARKDTRQHNLEDIFHRAMDSSDPIISHVNLNKRICQQKTLQLPEEVVALLKALNTNNTQNTNKSGLGKDETEEHEKCIEINQLYDIDEDCINDLVPVELLHSLELENE